MSAEQLRKAAALMRERAEAATPGPWSKVEHHGRDYTDEGYSYIYVGHGPGGLSGEVASTYPPGRENDPAEETAEHIASWHPAVALAVADWLDECADIKANPDVNAVLKIALTDRALQVAAAYLGEQP